jgi:hypothetical protein
MCGLAVGTMVIGRPANAQYAYPGGYGGYGWGGWSSDPAGGYMAGLGSYARNLGTYDIEEAQAQAINLDTMLKWNKALRARQKALAQEQAEADQQRLADRDARVAREELEDGTTLNRLLNRISDFDPGASKSSKAQTPISARSIQDIPFEWNTEAITICIDQLTGKDALPICLTTDQFTEERAALQKAVRAAIKEDMRGSVSPSTKRRLDEAITKFRDKFVKTVDKFDPGYQDARDYFTTMASLTKLLNDPAMRKIIAALGNDQQIPVGRLIAFMQSFNLRFGPATTQRQIEIYAALQDVLTQVMNDMSSAPPPPPPPIDSTGKELQSAAKDAFKKMPWKHLDAHSDSQ